MRRVVGAAILRDGLLLAAQRAEPEHMRGLWEFPGGKIRAGESDPEALVREIREELGCDIDVAGVLGEVEILDGQTTLTVYLAALTAQSPEPVALEHLSLKWVNRAGIAQIAWIPADLPLVEALVRASRLS